MQQVDQGTFTYGGVLHWNAFTEDYTDTVYPAIDIELYIKEHSIPGRRKNLNEINALSLRDPYTDRDRGVNAIFEGAPDLLTVTISGDLHTPISNIKSPPDSNTWVYPGYYIPKSASGSIITDLVGHHYGEVVMLLISGEINRSSGGAYQRKDPNYFIDAYGLKYNNPVIEAWESSSTSGVPQHQSFSATILLER